MFDRGVRGAIQNNRSTSMRKTFIAMAAVAALSTPALAQPVYDNTGAVELGTGAVVGTVAGVGVYNGWWGSTIGGAALPTSVAGSAALGGVAGVGTVAVVDAAIQPCRGFQAFFGLNQGACVNGDYVGYGPRHVIR
jgi:hypothetical protein